VRAETCTTAHPVETLEHKSFRFIRLQEYLDGAEDPRLQQLHAQMQAANPDLCASFEQPVVSLNIKTFMGNYVIYAEQTIKDPTDLGAIARDIGAGRITTDDDFHNESERMFTNAMSFTPSGDFHDYAAAMLQEVQLTRQAAADDAGVLATQQHGRSAGSLSSCSRQTAIRDRASSVERQRPRASHTVRWGWHDSSTHATL
jgi:hypothetical protein